MRGESPNCDIISAPSYHAQHEPIPTPRIEMDGSGVQSWSIVSCHGLQAPAHLHDRITAFLPHSLTTSGLAGCQDAALQPGMGLTHGSVFTIFAQLVGVALR